MTNEKYLIDMADLVQLVKKNAPYIYNILGPILSLCPRVDAVPVVHGKWNIDDYDSGDPGYYSAFIEAHCSKCGYELGAESGQYGWAYGDPFPLNYCPNCGARMDGGN